MPATFQVNRHLQVLQDDVGGAVNSARSVVFFEDNVSNYEVLCEGLASGTDAVILDSGGDGLREMAAFLSSYRDLTAVSVVAHGSAGAVNLGSTTLHAASLPSDAGERWRRSGASVALGGSLDLWSCDVGAGAAGQAFVGQLATEAGVGVAAASHLVGSAAAGGSWQLDVTRNGGNAAVPFQAAALAAFQGVLAGTVVQAANLNTGRAEFTSAVLTVAERGLMSSLPVAGTPQWRTLAKYGTLQPTTNTWTADRQPGHGPQGGN